MFVETKHKSTVVGKNELTYVYTVIDTEWSKDSKFTLPLKLAIKASYLSPVALHLAYQEYGRTRLAQELDRYYAWLQREGHDSTLIRERDYRFYQEALCV